VLTRLLGDGSLVSQLKGGLDASGRAVRGIAHRVANASNPDARFGEALDAAAAEAQGPDAGSAVDLEREMVALADERLRYDAAVQVLQKVYQQIRLGVRER
jgi:hypothetical protein